MTSIASTTAQPQSPLTRLQSELASEVSAGTISSDDQSALSSALTDIDSALKSGAQSGGQPPAPGDIQSKINDLIANEVSDGKLTSDQATELKNVFAQTFQNGPGGPGGPGAPGGPGGSSDNLGAGAGSSSNSDVSKVLSDFLKLIQDSQSSSATGYSASGDSLVSQIQSLIVNYSA